ncbi:PKD domain-containing protein, partial [Candidatus Pacearchaeota archaeon]|nr:PKD domain-containing protein [Candidatus Pacearchaeota archaeon]
MRKNLVLLGISLAISIIIFSSMISALTADVQVNEDPWYTARKVSNYGGTNMTGFYAPLPVFFEGWASSPRDDIVNYRWNFGDGNILEGSGMFNSAHIYETPGTYTTTLTVTDSSGATASDTIQITARSRDGTTYYVDSLIGNDNIYDGKCQTVSGGCGPWQTATKAFRMIGCGNNNTFYQPGDQILFKRGQTFYYQSSCGQSSVAQPGHYKAGYGYLFGAYGTGAKPIIKPANGVDAYLIAQTGLGMAFVTFRDLNFTGRADNGIVNSKEIFQSTQKIINILFYNNDFKDQGTAIVLSGSTACTDNINGAFIFNNTMFNSTRGVLFFAAAGRLAFIGNNLDLSENHDAYLDPIDNGIILDNTFSRPAHGRTALRIAGVGAPVNCPSNNIYVANNKMLGWIDPINCTQSPFTPQICTTDAECVDSDPYTLDEQCLNATSNLRCKYYTCTSSPTAPPASYISGSPAAHDGGGNTYNWLLTQFGPQESGYQSVQNIIFEDNTITNADSLLGIWAAENITIRNNLFISQTGTNKAGISVGSLYPGGAYNGQRPNRNVKIIGNTIAVKNAGHHISAVDSDHPIFTALNYPSSGHENIVFKNNLVYIGNKTRFGSSIIDNKIGSAFSSDYNVFYVVNANEANLSFNGAPGINFSQWKATTGNDIHSLISDPLLANVPNINLNPWFNGLLPIVDLRLLTGSPAIAAGANLGASLYYDIERKIRGSLMDIGAYEYTSSVGCNNNGIKETDEQCDLLDFGTSYNGLCTNYSATL